MGSSEPGDGEGGGIVDWEVGTIVWVRRRNGSWWPGRILGPEELPASQIMSPRSGTPVKLLGREDASVDWYNLEKSKRVKAFRCGEFDACIERAEASQGIPVKKREKYARREDAILHALELEKKQLALKCENQEIRSDDISSMAVFCSRNDMHEPHGKYGGHKAQDKKLGNIDQRYKSKKSKKQKEETFDDIHRTRDLQQYFVHATTERKLCDSLTLETEQNPISNHMDDFSDVRHIQGGISHSGGGNSTAVRKKKPQGSVPEESLVKKRDRRRPLVQVLQSSAKLPSHSFQHDNNSGAVSVEGEKDPMPVFCRAKRSRCVYLPADSRDSHNHGDLPSVQMSSTGDDFETESYLPQPASFSEEYTSSDLIEKNVSDSLERECSETETEEEADLLQSTNQMLPPESDACTYSLQASERFGNMESGEMPLSAYMPQSNAFEDTDDGSSELGVSKWHMKGKRNNRNVAKKPIDMTDGNLWLDKCNGFMKGSLHRSNESNPKKESMGTSSQRSFVQGFYQTKQEFDYDSDETDLIEKDMNHSDVARYYDKQYPSVLKATRDLGRSYTSFNDAENDSFKISPPNREADRLCHIGRKAYWEGSSFYSRNYVSRLCEVGPMLIDVDLKVQASYQGEHVPLVSLMSRLNGKAIVGHPIQIEILEDGSTSQLVLGSDTSLEDGTAATPVWRTGRRTAMQRIPRSNPARTNLEGDDNGGLLYSDQEIKPPAKKCSAPVNHQFRLEKRSISNARWPSSSSKFQKKPCKKTSLSSQKIRTLSSIATGKKLYRQGGQAKPSRRSDIFGGLIKPEGTVPLVTCVPVKVVFSRILEAVGRPSLSVAHRVRMASPAVQDPP